MKTDIEALDLPFTEAIAFFQRKARVPTKRWNDVWRSEHSHNFMVAGATSDALLSDFQKAIAKALTDGTTLAEFRKDFDDIVSRHGWAYNGSRDWRTRIIYETNLSTAYSAGRYMQLTEPETLEAFPYWRYVHSGSRHPRLQHLAWNGLTLRADDPFWQTHFPPNGWKCGCRVEPMSYGDLRRMGKKGPDASPVIQYRDWTDKVTGVVHQVPVGIDPGFDYNPGMAARTGLANVPVKSDPMRPNALPSTPKAPGAGDKAPVVPAALQRFLEASEEAPGQAVTVGYLPGAVQKLLRAPAPVRLTVANLAGIKADSRAEAGVLAQLVRRPTVALVLDGKVTLLLRQEGKVWAAGLAPGEKRSDVTGLRLVAPAELERMLDEQNVVYGDADDLGGDDE